MSSLNYLFGSIVGTNERTWSVISEEKSIDSIYDEYEEFSPMTFSSPIKNTGDRPVISGDFWIEITALDIVSAIEGARLIIDQIITQLQIEKKYIRYFINGSKSVQLCFDRKLYGDENGSTELLEIQRIMVNLLKFTPYTFLKDGRHCKINDDIYSRNKLFLVRNPNSPFEDGKYRIQLSAEDFLNEDIDALVKRTLEPSTEIRAVNVQNYNPTFRRIFELASSTIIHLRPSKDLLDSLCRCESFRYCYSNIDILDNEKLICFLKMLKCTYTNIDWIIEDICKMRKHLNKDDIKNQLFNIKGGYARCDEFRKILPCLPDCDVNCPFDLKYKQEADAAAVQSYYKNTDDGLYFSKSQWSVPGDETRLCSYLKVEGMIRDENNQGWGRIVTVKDPDDKTHEVELKMSECVSSGDVVISKLCDCGLELDKSNKALILNYINKYIPEIRYTRSSRIGWQRNMAYVLPDAVYGFDCIDHYKFSANDHPYKTSGTLSDWIENIGRKCVCHTFPEFVCQIALSGVLLRPMSIEGGGFHFYGRSSSGKSTLAYLAGSVLGGDGRHGFVSQWRGTVNAFEAMAVLHNDNTMILDEIGQGNPNDIYSLVYSLFNGKMKERCNIDAKLRSSQDWLLNCISTGEISMTEKISEDRYLKSKVGQEVRMPDIPVICDGINQIYDSSLDKKAQAELSEYLKKMSNTYYGTPLRKFLEIFNNKDKALYYLEQAKKTMNRFVEEKCKDASSGQIRRVARRFGLVAATGEMAVNEGIFPWSVDDAYNCCSHPFDLWFKEHGSNVDMEIERAISNIKEFIDHRKYTTFADKDKCNFIPDAGFTTFDKDLNARIYYFTSEAFNRIVGKINRNELMDELKKRNMCLLNSAGNRQTHVTVKGTAIDDRVRVYTFIYTMR